jgi:hypothetical protein
MLDKRNTQSCLAFILVVFLIFSFYGLVTVHENQLHNTELSALHANHHFGDTNSSNTKTSCSIFHLNILKTLLTAESKKNQILLSDINLFISFTILLSLFVIFKNIVSKQKLRHFLDIYVFSFFSEIGFWLILLERKAFAF